MKLISIQYSIKQERLLGIKDHTIESYLQYNPIYDGTDHKIDPFLRKTFVLSLSTTFDYSY